MNSIYKITILSDTHGKLSNKVVDAIIGKRKSKSILEQQKLFECSNEILKDLQINAWSKKPDLLIHTGDFTSQQICNEVENLSYELDCEIKCVLGNCDPCSLAMGGRVLNEFEYFNFAECPISIAHKPKTLKTYIDGEGAFRPAIIQTNIKPLLRIHGHTHEPKIKFVPEKYALICPGAATITPNHMEGKRSFANVYIFSGKPVYAQILEV